MLSVTGSGRHSQGVEAQAAGGYAVWEGQYVAWWPVIGHQRPGVRVKVVTSWLPCRLARVR
eukprot:scaffold139887_cov220-Phaeocystis_antarctica.AAC.1